MKGNHQRKALIKLILLLCVLFNQRLSAQNTAPNEVVFSGGYYTEPEDHGRPVILIASALSVPPAVFRTAFSKVTPAHAGEAPDPKQVMLNKKALLDDLSLYGITNDFLDQVSNYYRYSGSKGEVWKRTPAKAIAIIQNNKITGFKILDGGNGYTTAPSVTVVGSNVKVQAVIAFSKDFGKNGRITELKIVP